MSIFKNIKNIKNAVSAKHIIALAAAAVLTAGMTLTAFAVDSSALSSAASLNLSNDPDSSMSDFKALYADGVRVFDEGQLLSDSERADIQSAAEKYINSYKMDICVLTVNDYAGMDIGEYADQIYDDGELGVGSDDSGSMLVLNMNDSGVYITTAGDTIRYITDDRLDDIYDSYIIPSLQSGNVAAALKGYVDGVTKYTEAGIPSDQQNYNTQTGEIDNYAGDYKEKKSFFAYVIQAIISAIVAAISAFIPTNSIKSKYAMKSEKAQAENFKLAYRSEAAFKFAEGAAQARLIDRQVRTVPIPKPVKSSGPSSGHVSSVHTSSGGHVHGGGGRKF